MKVLCAVIFISFSFRFLFATPSPFVSWKIILNLVQAWWSSKMIRHLNRIQGPGSSHETLYENHLIIVLVTVRRRRFTSLFFSLARIQKISAIYALDVRRFANLAIQLQTLLLLVCSPLNFSLFLLFMIVVKYGKITTTRKLIFFAFSNPRFTFRLFSPVSPNNLFILN